MTIEHTNRKGDVYHLQSGVTPTGKPRYWFGRKLTGAPVESVPEGYEIYEQPANAQVLLRKSKPSKILSTEQEMVVEGVRRHAGLEHLIVDVDVDSLVVYLPNIDVAAIDEMIEELAGPGMSESARGREFRQKAIQTASYEKMMRFALVDNDDRTFQTYRWCFRGSIDDWIPVGGFGSLDELVRAHTKHLGRESFFDMI